MLHRAPDYMRLRAGFSWRIPEYYNIADDICDRHAAYSGSPALIVVERGGQVAVHTFDDVRRQSNRLANVLLAHGARRTDRLAILLPQAPETLFAHVAAFKAGLVSVPLFSLFGADALEYRLANSGARFLVTDEAGLLKIEPLRGRLPELRLVLVIGDPRSYGAGTESFTETLARASDRFVNVRTRAEDPALIIYTSGTTGNPRGALHAHRVLLGHLPGVELSHDFFPQAGDVAWTPADWAWIGGLLDILLPSLHHGIPVVAYRARKFDPEEAYWLMASRRIRNVFLPPTALKLMRQADARALGAHRIRSVASGGEPLGDDLLEWGRRTFGVTINEFYGQTECNMVVCNDAELFAVKPGSMGRAVPGHDVRVVDETGNPVATGATGMLGIRRPDPVMFLGYWRDDAATTAKYAGDFLLTGDHGREDEDGYLWVRGTIRRSDHERRVPHRTRRNRRVSSQASCGRNRRRRRRSGSGADAARQSRHRARGRRRRVARARARNPRIREAPFGCARVSAHRGIRRGAAVDDQRQDHATGAPCQACRAERRDGAVGKARAASLRRCDAAFTAPPVPTRTSWR
jgi:acetyl-CoA synthetase